SVIFASSAGGAEQEAHGQGKQTGYPQHDHETLESPQRFTANAVECLATVMELSDWLGREAVAVDNPGGRGPFVLVCDHASNWVPPSLKGLGLPPGELERHIAWDPGALELARVLSNLLDAPLVHATVSRLVLDVNRDPTHPGSVVMRSEDTD